MPGCAKLVSSNRAASTNARQPLHSFGSKLFHGFVDRSGALRDVVPARQNSEPPSCRGPTQSVHNSRRRSLLFLGAGRQSFIAHGLCARTNAAGGLHDPRYRRWTVPTIERAVSGRARCRMRDRRTPSALAHYAGLRCMGAPRCHRCVELHRSSFLRRAVTATPSAAHSNTLACGAVDHESTFAYSSRTFTQPPHTTLHSTDSQRSCLRKLRAGLLLSL
jgi:hypothetical protein